MEENRRVRMTKRLLQDALLELLEEKSLEKITVTQVCSKADVNRSTFYAYYQDVGELLSELEDGVLEKIPGAQKVPVARTDSEFVDTLERFFDYVKENRRLFTILLIRRGSGNFNHRLLDAVMEKHLKPTQQEPTRLDRYAYVYCINGVMGILKEWLQEGFPFSSREFGQIVLRMSAGAVAERM